MNDRSTRPNAARRRRYRGLLYARQNGECAWCHTSLEGPHDGQLDRVTPGAWGGTYRLDNLVLACGPCNLAHGLDVRMGVAIERIRP